MADYDAIIIGSGFGASCAAIELAGRPAPADARAGNERYRPALVRLRQVICSGVIGEVLLVCVNALKRQHREGWRGDRSLCAGPLLEGGVHWLDLMTNTTVVFPVPMELMKAFGQANDGRTRGAS